MREVVQQLLSAEFWILTVIGSVVVTFGATRLRWLMHFFDRKGDHSTLRYALRSILCLMALAVPIIAGSGYGPFVARWFMDAWLGVCIGGIYFLVANTPSVRLQLLAILLPFSILTYFVIVMTHLGQKTIETAYGVMVIYPAIAMACTIPILICFSVVLGSLIREEYQCQMA